MHITVETEVLRKRLEILTRVSTKHVTLPVLQCVVIEAAADTILLKATNLEIGIETTIPAQVGEPGVIAVPATTLLQIINLATQKTVTLRVEDTTLIIEGAGSEAHLKSIPADEFPTIPKLDTAGQPIHRQLFALAIKTCAFAASQSSIKPELGSLYIVQKREHTLTVVATDSFRLMEKTVPQQGLILEESVLIPQKNAAEIARICDLETEDPTMRLSENQFSLEFPDGVYITSRLTNGSFPDYVQIIPKEYLTHSTLLRDDLVHAFKKTNIFLNKFFQVALHVTSSSLTVSATSGDVGATTESIKATTEGEDLTLNFNQRYLFEPLAHFSDDSITLHFAGIGRPLVMEGVNDKSLRYLVMPMNK